MIDDVTLGALRGAMDTSALRHQVLADNIANARTPGYHARDVSFGSMVAEARCDARFNGVAQVDVGQEIASMTDNAIRYQSLAQLATSRLHMLSGIAHDGRR